MANKFYNVSKQEMEELLFPQGFVPLSLEGTTELVYAKIFRKGEHKVSMRIYSGIWPSGVSRGVGEDCIRVKLYFMFDGKPVSVSKARRVLRVQNWASNLQKAIDKESEMRTCGRCGWPMVLRTGPRGSFWGCVTFKRTDCNGKPIDEGVEPPKPAPLPERPTVQVQPSKLAPQPTRRLPVARPVQPPGRVLSNPTVVPPTVVSQFERPKPTPSVAPGSYRSPKPAPTEAPKHRSRPHSNDPMEKFRIPVDKISDEQKEGTTLYRTTDYHLMHESRAGGGKTTLMKHYSSYRKEQQRLIYLAFGKRNAREGIKKLPAFVPSRTTHSFCLSTIRKSIKDLPERADDSKTWQILQELYPSLGMPDRKRIRNAIFKLVGLAKNWACRPGDVNALKDVMDRYDFDLDVELPSTTERASDEPAPSPSETDLVIEVTNEVLMMSKPGEKFGKIFDLNDMLWWFVIMDMIPDYYDHAFNDEVQDYNSCQITLVKRMMDRGTRIIAVGDPFQCQPGDVMIEMTGGGQKRLDEVNIGDEIVSYDRHSSAFVGRKNQGRKVLDKASREFSGDLLVVKANHKEADCTPEHKWLVRFVGTHGTYCNYLMRQGQRWRTGVCKMHHKEGLGLVRRANREEADAAWILKIQPSLEAAMVEEDLITLRYGVPQTLFVPVAERMATIGYIEEVFKQMGDLSLNGWRVLNAYGRSARHPFWTPEMRKYQGGKKLFVTEACNLFSGYMSVASYDGDKTPIWHPIQVDRKPYTGTVYSLQVETHELYVANGLLTHNCINRFRGADNDAFWKVKAALDEDKRGSRSVFLPTCYRCSTSIIDYVRANTIVKDIVAAPDAPVGEVREDLSYHQMLDILIEEYGAA